MSGHSCRTEKEMGLLQVFPDKEEEIPTILHIAGGDVTLAYDLLYDLAGKAQVKRRTQPRQNPCPESLDSQEGKYLKAKWVPKKRVTKAEDVVGRVVTFAAEGTTTAGIVEAYADGVVTVHTGVKSLPVSVGSLLDDWEDASFREELLDKAKDAAGRREAAKWDDFVQYVSGCTDADVKAKLLRAWDKAVSTPSAPTEALRALNDICWGVLKVGAAGVDLVACSQYSAHLFAGIEDLETWYSARRSHYRFSKHGYTIVFILPIFSPITAAISDVKGRSFDELIGMQPHDRDAITRLMDEVARGFVEEAIKSFKGIAGPEPLLKPIQNDSSDETCFELFEGASEALREMSGPFHIVSIVGVMRSGKSFFLTQVLRGMLGPSFVRGNRFEVNGGITSFTKGVWYAAFPHPIAGTIILLDTEGSGSTERDPQYDAKVFSIQFSLSSVVMFNAKPPFNDASTLSAFECSVEMGKHVRQRLGEADNTLGQKSIMMLCRDSPHASQDSDPVTRRQASGLFSDDVPESGDTNDSELLEQLAVHGFGDLLAAKDGVARLSDELDHASSRDVAALTKLLAQVKTAKARRGLATRQGNVDTRWKSFESAFGSDIEVFLLGPPVDSFEECSRADLLTCPLHLLDTAFVEPFHRCFNHLCTTLVGKPFTLGGTAVTCGADVAQYVVQLVDSLNDRNNKNPFPELSNVMTMMQDLGTNNRLTYYEQLFRTWGNGLSYPMLPAELFKGCRKQVALLTKQMKEDAKANTLCAPNETRLNEQLHEWEQKLFGDQFHGELVAKNKTASEQLLFTTCHGHYDELIRPHLESDTFCVDTASGVMQTIRSMLQGRVDGVMLEQSLQEFKKTVAQQAKVYEELHKVAKRQKETELQLRTAQENARAQQSLFNKQSAELEEQLLQEQAKGAKGSKKIAELKKQAENIDAKSKAAQEEVQKFKRHKETLEKQAQRNKDQLDERETAATELANKLSRAVEQANSNEREVRRLRNKSSCFAGTASVLLEDGTTTKQVSQVQKEDKLWSVGGGTAVVHFVDTTYLGSRTLVGLNGRAPVMTCDHPVPSAHDMETLLFVDKKAAVAARHWKHAASLSKGSEVLTPNGPMTVGTISRHRKEATFKVYDIITDVPYYCVEGVVVRSDAPEVEAYPVEALLIVKVALVMCKHDKLRGRYSASSPKPDVFSSIALEYVRRLEAVAIASRRCGAGDGSAANKFAASDYVREKASAVQGELFQKVEDDPSLPWCAVELWRDALPLFRCLAQAVSDEESFLGLGVAVEDVAQQLWFPDDCGAGDEQVSLSEWADTGALRKYVEGEGLRQGVDRIQDIKERLSKMVNTGNGEKEPAKALRAEIVRHSVFETKATPEMKNELQHGVLAEFVGGKLVVNSATVKRLVANGGTRLGEVVGFCGEKGSGKTGLISIRASGLGFDVDSFSSSDSYSNSNKVAVAWGVTTEGVTNMYLKGPGFGKDVMSLHTTSQDCAVYTLLGLCCQTVVVNSVSAGHGLPRHLSDILKLAGTVLKSKVDAEHYRQSRSDAGVFVLTEANLRPLREALHRRIVNSEMGARSTWYPRVCYVCQSCNRDERCEASWLQELEKHNADYPSTACFRLGAVFEGFSSSDGLLVVAGHSSTQAKIRPAFREDLRRFTDFLEDTTTSNHAACTPAAWVQHVEAAAVQLVSIHEDDPSVRTNTVYCGLSPLADLPDATLSLMYAHAVEDHQTLCCSMFNNDWDVISEALVEEKLSSARGTVAASLTTRLGRLAGDKTTVRHARDKTLEKLLAKTRTTEDTIRRDHKAHWEGKVLTELDTKWSAARDKLFATDSGGMGVEFFIQNVTNLLQDYRKNSPAPYKEKSIATFLRRRLLEDGEGSGYLGTVQAHIRDTAAAYAAMEESLDEHSNNLASMHTFHAAKLDALRADVDDLSRQYLDRARQLDKTALKITKAQKRVLDTSQQVEEVRTCLAELRRNNAECSAQISSLEAFGKEVMKACTELQKSNTETAALQREVGERKGNWFWQFVASVSVGLLGCVFAFGSTLPALGAGMMSAGVSGVYSAGTGAGTFVKQLVTSMATSFASCGLGVALQAIPSTLVRNAVSHVAIGASGKVIANVIRGVSPFSGLGKEVLAGAFTGCASALSGTAAFRKAMTQLGAVEGRMLGRAKKLIGDVCSTSLSAAVKGESVVEALKYMTASKGMMSGLSKAGKKVFAEHKVTNARNKPNDSDAALREVISFLEAVEDSDPASADVAGPWDSGVGIEGQPDNAAAALDDLMSALRAEATKVSAAELAPHLAEPCGDGVLGDPSGSNALDVAISAFQAEVGAVGPHEAWSGDPLCSPVAASDDAMSQLLAMATKVSAADIAAADPWGADFIAKQSADSTERTWWTQVGEACDAASMVRFMLQHPRCSSALLLLSPVGSGAFEFFRSCTSLRSFTTYCAGELLNLSAFTKSAARVIGLFTPQHVLLFIVGAACVENAGQIIQWSMEADERVKINEELHFRLLTGETLMDIGVAGG